MKLPSGPAGGGQSLGETLTQHAAVVFDHPLADEVDGG